MSRTLVALLLAGSVAWPTRGSAQEPELRAGRVGVRGMFSAEPWTVPGCGSLNFLATGEVCEGDTIHDRQQPHDLFMELSAEYEHRLRGAWRWQLYAGLAGEPALGPPGYLHRASAMGNPTGPLTHHWLDGTHVSFGVVTIGLHNQRWKVEASALNGRERRPRCDNGGRPHRKQCDGVQSAYCLRQRRDRADAGPPSPRA